MQNYLKIFGIDMSGTLINADGKMGNNIAYETSLSEDLFEFLAEALEEESFYRAGSKNILVKDIKKYSIVKFYKKKYKLSLESNWKRLYTFIDDKTIFNTNIVVEDSLHLFGSTREYFLKHDLDEYVHNLVQRILFKEVEVLITDSFIAENIAKCIKDYFPKTDFYLLLDKDTNSYGTSNKLLWQKWLYACRRFKGHNALDFFSSSENHLIKVGKKEQKRPENCLIVKKFGPEDI